MLNKQSNVRNVSKIRQNGEVKRCFSWRRQLQLKSMDAFKMFNSEDAVKTCQIDFTFGLKVYRVREMTFRLLSLFYECDIFPLSSRSKFHFDNMTDTHLLAEFSDD